MISADLVSGKLDWNSSITGPTTLSAMKAKGYMYKRKKPVMKEMKPMKRSPESHLDNLVSMMKDKEVIPKMLETEAKGTGRPKKMSLDSIAAKYGVKTNPVARGRKPAAPKEPKPRKPRAVKKST